MLQPTQNFGQELNPPPEASLTNTQVLMQICMHQNGTKNVVVAGEKRKRKKANESLEQLKAIIKEEIKKWNR